MYHLLFVASLMLCSGQLASARRSYNEIHQPLYLSEEYEPVLPRKPVTRYEFFLLPVAFPALINNLSLIKYAVLLTEGMMSTLLQHAPLRKL